MTGLLTLKKIQGFLPFSYKNIFSYVVDKKGKTILDIGTGDGYLMEHVNFARNFKITGIEPYKPFLKRALKSGAYDKIIVGNAQNLKYLPDSFDIVISSQVLEYLTKREGIEFIKKCKKIAKRQTIIAAYIGDCKHVNAEGNPYQTAKSEWYPEDLRKLGFRVYGQGLRLVYKENGYNPKKIDFKFILPMIFSYLISPLVYYFPGLATHMIGIQNKYDK